VLRELAPIGGWSAAGSGTHWVFSQGYNYVVAAALDVRSVAALAATRLLMMPVNLLSSGITSLMMPFAASWLTAHGPAVLFKRLWAIACAIGALSVCYFVIVWFGRELIFDHAFHKHFEHSDSLLLLWSAVFLVMVFRDQLQYLPGASMLYRRLTAITASSALISLAFSFVALQHLGSVGAPLGVLVGEICNVAGIIFLSIRRIRQGHTPAANAG